MEGNRLIEIETRLAYQEQIIRDLNEVVCEQQQAIETLEKGYKRLTKLVNEQARMNSGIEGPANEKPPHY